MSFLSRWCAALGRRPSGDSFSWRLQQAELPDEFLKDPEAYRKKKIAEHLLALEVEESRLHHQIMGRRGATSAPSASARTAPVPNAVGDFRPPGVSLTVTMFDGSETTTRWSLPKGLSPSDLSWLSEIVGSSVAYGIGAKPSRQDGSIFFADPTRKP